LKTFGILLGVTTFVSNFLKSCYQDWRLLSPDRIEPSLLALLQQSTIRVETCSGLVEQFATVTRALIADQTLVPCSVRETSDTRHVIYYDRISLFFPGPALSEICRRLSASRPEVIQALLTAGTIIGTPINAASTQTRVRVSTPQGFVKSVCAHRIKRELFDFSGDPLTFKEEF